MRRVNKDKTKLKMNLLKSLMSNTSFQQHKNVLLEFIKSGEDAELWEDLWDYLKDPKVVVKR
jgi:hypothetical protein